MSKLPSSWARVKLADIGTWRGGGTPSKANPAFWTNGTIPWVSPKDMKRPKLSTAQDLITEAAVKASATSLIDAGSVLMVTRSGILSHSLPVAVNLVPVALNQDIKAVSPSPATDGLFLWFAFKCFERDILNECRKGGLRGQAHRPMAQTKSPPPRSPRPTPKPHPSQPNSERASPIQIDSRGH